MSFNATFFWTDSSTVLRWIYSESGRFHTFVANRVAEIQELTANSGWRHVPGTMNPADICSRGCRVTELGADGDWLRGPEFLWRPESTWPIADPQCVLPEDGELELRQTKQALATTGSCRANVIEPCHYSSWTKLLRLTAWVQRFVHNARSRTQSVNDEFTGPLTADEMRRAELYWLRQVQQNCFANEVASMMAKKSLPRRSRLLALTPYLDADGLLRVGGRLEHADLPFESRHQIILPPGHDVTRLIVDDRHRKLSHCGVDHLLSALRERFWILRGRSTARRWTLACPFCRNRRAKPQPPIMSCLPRSRLDDSGRPFSTVGVDYFGPVHVRHLRRNEKRYGVLFTCLTSRAIHLEVAHSLDVDSFLMALRRMIARRGKPSVVLSDQGTNFKAGEQELKRCIREWNQTKIAETLSQEQIEWKFNPPASPHFGGVWESLVKSVKRALQSSLSYGISDETLLTVLTEAEGMLNSRPLTHVSTDPNDLEALTPNHLLTGYACRNLPPGVFTDGDLCGRRRWRHAQRMADYFWQRWRREYLPGLIAIGTKPRSLYQACQSSLREVSGSNDAATRCRHSQRRGRRAGAWWILDGDVTPVREAVFSRAGKEVL